MCPIASRVHGARVASARDGVKQRLVPIAAEATNCRRHAPRRVMFVPPQGVSSHTEWLANIRLPRVEDPLTS